MASNCFLMELSWQLPHFSPNKIASARMSSYHPFLYHSLSLSYSLSFFLSHPIGPKTNNINSKAQIYKLNFAISMFSNWIFPESAWVCVCVCMCVCECLSLSHFSTSVLAIFPIRKCLFATNGDTLWIRVTVRRMENSNLIANGFWIVAKTWASDRSHQPQIV